MTPQAGQGQTSLSPDETTDAGATSSPDADPDATADAQQSDASSPAAVRFATYNTSLFRTAAGKLASDLATGNDAQARSVAAVLQRTRPDVVLLNEFDYDAQGSAAKALQEKYLDVAQNGGTPIHYDHVYVATSNTGTPSGFDLDNNGAVGGAIGSRPYGDDSLGYGIFPGQYSFVVLSRYPIDRENVRTFQKFLWKDMPGAALPDNASTGAAADWFSSAELAVVRLSSKNHADVPIRIGDLTVHLLASHPTPPSFDGAERRNDRRNHDEIRLWADYIEPDKSAYLVDDNGKRGGLEPGASFVIAGDLNADPVDGDNFEKPTAKLLASPRVNATFAPKSEGATEQSTKQGRINADHRGPPELDTADFADGTPGNLRVDFVIPSRDLEVRAGGVFWPVSSDPSYSLVDGVSDHHLVWSDLAVGGAK